MSSKWTERRQKGWLLLEALAWLGIMRIAILTVPFRRVVEYYQLKQGEAAATATAIDTATAERVGWAVRIAASRTPWQSACLVQSLAAMRMLRKRGIQGTLYLGVAKNGVDAAEPIAAHSWLCCGSMTLTGAFADNRFTVIAKFTW